MVFRYKWDLSECKKWNWRPKSLLKCPCSSFDVLALFCPVFRFLTEIHAMHGWTATASHEVTRKKPQGN